jgi:hypothetical protein
MSEKTYNAERTVEIKAIIIACLDPRFHYAFRDFIRDELTLEAPEFVLFAVAGGPGALAHPVKYPDDFSYLQRQINFCLKHFSEVTNIVLIGHEDCGYYNGHINLPGEEKNDLKKAGNFVSVLFGKTVELYYAKFDGSEKSKIVFEDIS